MGPQRGGAAVAGAVVVREVVVGEAELRAALVGADLDSLSSEASLAALRALWPLICAAQAQVARRVGRVHGSGAAKQDRGGLDPGLAADPAPRRWWPAPFPPRSPRRSSANAAGGGLEPPPQAPPVFALAKGQWTLNLHPITLEVRVFRPDGRLHDLTSKPRGPTARR